LRGTVAVKRQGVIAATSILVVSVIVVLAWLLAFPRIGDNPAADRTAIEPNASPALPAEPSAGRPSRKPAAAAKPADVASGQRHSDADPDRNIDRDREVLLGVLMLFLAGERQTQAP
jgi:hypothetical protein